MGVAYGEAGRDLISDEAGGTLHEHRDTGMDRFKAEHRWLTEALPMNLKRSNRSVRTRMPGVWQGCLLPKALYADGHAQDKRAPS